MRRALLLVATLVACKQQASKLDESAAKSPSPRHDAAVTTKSLESQLEEIRAKLELPALASAMWRDGKVVEIGVVGVRKADDPTKATKTDRWHIGSNTKAMTATLIAIFVDRGKLRWTDTLSTLFPGWKLDPSYAKVTLDQLIRHTGGAPGQPPDAVWRQLWADADAPDARTKFVKAILAAPPAQAPGNFVYSNAGYMIAGAALERVTGQRWEQLMKDELFAKLDMQSCGFGAPGTKGTVDEPRGHDAGGTAIEPGPAADNPAGLGPAGTVHCSLEDYGKFLNMHVLGTPALVTPESMQHLHTARDGNYAGGWIVIPSAKGSQLGHSGSNTMWYATAVLAPADKAAFVIVTNKGESALENSFLDLLARYK